ncbi:MAG: molybdenum cofactor guanylyltransferase [Candidatus Bathyarchaeia archaeon]
MVKKCAIVLAGGKAERFQVKDSPWIDKALANVIGKPLLIHVIERVKPVVEEIIICVNNETRRRKYMRVLRNFLIKNDYVKIVKDFKIPSISGPAVAIATGLSVSNADHCIIVPCDTPFIQPAVVDYLFNAIGDASIAVPIHADGSAETLMFTCERGKIAEISETLCWLGRDRPDDLLRGSPKVKFISTKRLKNLDPEFKSFININFQKDLAELRTRVTLNGPIKRNVCINLGAPKSFELKMLKKAAEKYLHNKFIEAVKVFSSLSNFFEERRLYFWAGLCWEKEGSAIQTLIKNRRDMETKSEWREKSKQAFRKAVQNYALEAEIFTRKQIYLLAKRAKEDELWCKHLSS